MNDLEAAGFVHLYGLSSVLNALEANRRDFSSDKERNSYEDDDDGSASVKREPPKPAAQFKPFLFVQERESSTRKGQKATDAERVLALAEERGVPVAEVDKGILNTLSGNRPHQVRTVRMTYML
jgi:RNA 2'-O ribose methyltransferase substrate binding